MEGRWAGWAGSPPGDRLCPPHSIAANVSTNLSAFACSSRANPSLPQSYWTPAISVPLCTVPHSCSQPCSVPVQDLHHQHQAKHLLLPPFPFITSPISYIPLGPATLLAQVQQPTSRAPTPSHSGSTYWVSLPACCLEAHNTAKLSPCLHVQGIFLSHPSSLLHSHPYAYLPSTPGHRNPPQLT